MSLTVKSLEDIVEKGESAGVQDFLHSPQLYLHLPNAFPNDKF